MQAPVTQLVERHLHGCATPLQPMNYKKESGQRLREAREDKRLTLGDLSARLGGFLSPSRISNYEQGLRMIGVKEALAIAPILSVEPAHLLCVDIGDAEMTPQERQLMRNFRALPEKDRNEYARRIEVLAMAYREPVPDERLSIDVRRGVRKPVKSR